MNKTRTYKLGDVRLKLSPNGYPCGFVMKRKLNLRECKHILSVILAINLNTKDCFFDNEEYNDYNNELEKDVNEWLEGNADDEVLSEYEGECYADQLGLFNMLPLITYLTKIEAI